FNSKLESKNILSDSRIQLQIIISGLKSGLNIFQLFQIVDLSKSFSSIKETRIKEAVNNGVSPVPYLKRQIQEINLKQKTEAKILTENLGTKLIIPLGLCYLPSFIFLGIMPIVISMITEI
ncbi:MAG: hypothetical protein LBM13_03150, partial [Candidatus Ancillula sp.]|nr:hypothetical protein [Candidatus Ancillula sp.]